LLVHAAMPIKTAEQGLKDILPLAA
jgi:hypothetical protein